jgi:hypothetical protein
MSVSSKEGVSMLNWTFWWIIPDGLGIISAEGSFYSLTVSSFKMGHHIALKCRGVIMQHHVSEEWNPWF